MVLSVGKSITLDNLKKVIAYMDKDANGKVSLDEANNIDIESKNSTAQIRNEKATKLLDLIKNNAKYAAFVPLVQGVITDTAALMKSYEPVLNNAGNVQANFLAYAGVDTTTSSVRGYAELTTADASAIGTFIGSTAADADVKVDQKTVRDIMVSLVQQGDATAAGTYVTTSGDNALLKTDTETLSESQLKDRVKTLTAGAANNSDTAVAATMARAALLGKLLGGDNAFSSNDYVNAASGDNDAGSLSKADIAFFKDADGKFNKPSVLNAYYRNNDTAANVAQVINNINRDGASIDQLNARVVDIAPRIKTLMDFVAANSGLVTQSDFGPIVNKIITAVQRFRLLTEVVAPKLGKTAGTDVLTYNQATDSSVSGLIDSNGKYIVG